MNAYTVPSELFISYFKPSVRVLFNWDRMRREKWRVKLNLTEKSSSLHSLYLPWYIGENERETSYLASMSKPIALSDIPNVLSLLKKKRQQLILNFSKSFNKDRQPVQLVVPAYTLGKNQSILLDGNHRMAALAISQVTFRVMTFTVFGPMDSNILPDLQHWIKVK